VPFVVFVHERHAVLGKLQEGPAEERQLHARFERRQTPPALRSSAPRAAACRLVVRGVLVLAGLGAVAMIAALWRVSPVISARARRIALAGALAFAFQTAVLDALVWPAYFRG
jgi:hypothetical protein